jgi:hypothetical protein
MKKTFQIAILGLPLAVSSCASPCNSFGLDLIPITPPGQWDMTKSGTTEKEAVSITQAKDRKNISDTEELWIVEKIPHKYFWDEGKLVDRQLMPSKDRKVERVNWIYHGQLLAYYFDITHAMEEPNQTPEPTRSAGGSS